MDWNLFLLRCNQIWLQDTGDNLEVDLIRRKQNIVTLSKEIYRMLITPPFVVRKPTGIHFIQQQLQSQAQAEAAAAQAQIAQQAAFAAEQQQQSVEASVANDTIALGRTQFFIDATDFVIDAPTSSYYTDPQYTATRPVNVRIGPTSTTNDPTVSTTNSATFSGTVATNYVINPSVDYSLAIKELANNESFIGVPVRQQPVAI